MFGKRVLGRDRNISERISGRERVYC